MRNVFLASALVLASSSDGCDSQPENKAPNQRRIQVVESWDESDLKWKLVRDNKSEKEWLIITDNFTDVLTVVPLDGSQPINAAKAVDD